MAIYVRSLAIVCVLAAVSACNNDFSYPSGYGAPYRGAYPKNGDQSAMPDGMAGSPVMAPPPQGMNPNAQPFTPMSLSQNQFAMGRGMGQIPPMSQPQMMGGQPQMGGALPPATMPLPVVATAPQVPMNAPAPFNPMIGQKPNMGGQMMQAASMTAAPGIPVPTIPDNNTGAISAGLPGAKQSYNGNFTPVEKVMPPIPPRPINEATVKENYYQTFVKSLAKYYGAQADQYRKLNKEKDYQRFFLKAQSAANMYDVLPDEIDGLSIPAEKKSALSAARKQFDSVRSSRIMPEQPDEIAKLQVNYDCMITEIRDSLDIASDANSCAAQFYSTLLKFARPSPASFTADDAKDLTNLALIEAQGGNAPDPYKAPVVAQKPAKQSIPSDEEDDIKYGKTRSFVIYFDMGKTNINKQASKYVLNKIMEYIALYEDYEINVLGYTDRVSGKDFNQKLSKKRAEVVYSNLVDMGVDPIKVKIVAFGQDYNSINTLDGVGEQMNRRVVVEVTGKGEFNENTFILREEMENQSGS